MNVLILVLAMGLWGALHSFLASLTFKNFLRHFGERGFLRFYRLFYNGFSLISFLPVLWLTIILPDRSLYQIPAPWSVLMGVGQGIALIFLLIGVFQTDAMSFAGVRQLWEGEKPASLVITGFYRYVRHPLYTAGLVFIWLTPVMTVNRLTLYLSATFYLLIGAYFEERKLLREFGEAYARYRNTTPMLIPRWKNHR